MFRVNNWKYLIPSFRENKRKKIRHKMLSAPACTTEEKKKSKAMCVIDISKLNTNLDEMK
jgi:hypothetical protein